MKKLIVLFVLVAFAGFALAEAPPNAGFESGMSGWGTWGSGSGSGPSGYKWTSHWAYIDTTGNGAGGSQNFMNLTTASQAGYCEYWGYGYNITWRDSYDEIIPILEGECTMIGGWFKDLGGAGTGELKFEWLDASGRKSQDGGLVLSQSVFFPVTTDWAYYEEQMMAPVNTYSVRPCWANPNPGGELGLDLVIPESMSIALLGLGGLFLRRRK